MILYPGLDSQTTLGLCEALKQIATEQNRTVVLTIHQPAAKVFKMFDKVLFLSAGKVTFLGKAKELLPFTTKFVNKHDIKLIGTSSEEEVRDTLSGNPPEVFLELCDQLITEDGIEVLVNEMSQSLGVTKTTSIDLSDDSNRLSVFGGDEGKKMKEIQYVEYANEWWPEIKLLMRRGWMNFLRTPEVFQARIGASVIFGVLVGTLFYDTQNDALGVSKRASYFIFTIANFDYTALDAIQIILQEREIFQREYSR